MISLASAAAFVPVAALIVAIPGPSVLFAVGRALVVGRRSALLTVGGNGIGLLVQAAVIACGVGALLAAVSGALLTLKIVGGLYLVWLGVQALRHRNGAMPGDAGGARAVSIWADLRTGFVVGVTNPKTLVFLTALLPQFVPSSSEPVPQMLLLGLVFSVVAVLGDSVWALTAGAARTWFARSPRRLAAVQAGGGVALIGLGVYSMASGSID